MCRIQDAQFNFQAQLLSIAQLIFSSSVAFIRTKWRWGLELELELGLELAITAKDAYLAYELAKVPHPQ